MYMAMACKLEENSLEEIVHKYLGACSGGGRPERMFRDRKSILDHKVIDVVYSTYTEVAKTKTRWMIAVDR